MRKIKKILLASSLMLVASVSAAVAASCDDKNSVKLSFNTNGGETIAGVTVNKGETYELPIPSRQGYSFEGWFTNADCTGSPVQSIVAEKGVTYYAKWVKAYEIKLELDGGSFEHTSVYLKAGANIYDYMQTFKAPTKSGLTFGAWFDGENELSKNKRMTTERITLKAKYKVNYTIELYKEKLDGGFEEKPELVTGSDYVGKETTVSYTVQGFTPTTTADTVAIGTLSANASENKFKLYFNRVAFDVVFDANYPNGKASASAPVAVKYQDSIVVPNDVVFDGYCLLGWSKSKTATTPEYKSNYLQSVLFNKTEDDEMESDFFSPDRTTTLYAVWAKGHSDMFGAKDYLYIFDENSDTAYLNRGGVFFKCKYDNDLQCFTYIDGNDDMHVGFIRDGFTYVYQDQNREGTRTRYVTERDQTTGQTVARFIETETIYFGSTDEITYFVEKEDKKLEESHGTYKVSGSQYIATFTDGELAGKTLTLHIGTLGTNKTPVFQLRNEEDIELGKLKKIETQGTDFVTYNIYQIELNGFGVATYTTNLNGSRTSYYYTRSEDGNVIVLTDSRGGVFKTVKIVTEGNKQYYVDYEEIYDRTFELADGSKLTLDGGYKAVYEKDGVSVDGYFSWEESVFGGKIVTMQKGTETYKFLIKTTKVPETSDGEEAQDEYLFAVETKAPEYKEYRYNGKKGTYDAPLLTLNDPALEKATVYGKTAEGKWLAVYVGDFAEQDYNGKTLYVFKNAEKVTDEEVVSDVVDLTRVKTFVFDINSTATAYNIAYWYSSTNYNDETATYDVVYTGAQTGETLTLVGGVAIYSYAGSVVVGAYTVEDTLMSIKDKNGNEKYLTINESAKTFVTLNEKPVTAMRYGKSGVRDLTAKLSLDGKGGATYQTMSLDQSGEEVIDGVYEGTVTDTGKTTHTSAPIKKFTSQEVEFEFIELFAGSDRYFAMFNEEVNGGYVSETDGYLVLDGFSWEASYTDMDGDVHDGRYVIDENGVVCFTANNETYYFEVSNDATFIMRGSEYATYLLMENRTFDGIYLEFDGRNKLVVYRFDEVDGESVRVDIDVNGSYEKNGDVYTITYTDNDETTEDAGEVKLEGEVGAYKVGDGAYNAFFVSNKTVMMTYVNPLDYSVLILDDVGNATKYDEAGKKDTGTYTLISNELLYYVNSAQNDACLYEYNVEDKTASLIKFMPKGYYTADLEALFFTEYGFVSCGSERYYYNTEDGDIYIYRQPREDETVAPGDVNDYGFLREYFGEIEDVKTYGGKTYYLHKNEFLGLEFSRETATASNYPVSVQGKGKLCLKALTFIPSGDYEFSVEGEVVLGEVGSNAKNTTYPCYVVRELDENGEEKMYVVLSGGSGEFRFDINVTYNGNNNLGEDTTVALNTYEVTGMSWVCEMLSYIYLNVYAQTYMYYGASAANDVENTYGSVKYLRTFDEAGEEQSFRLFAEFGEGLGLYDYNGVALKEFEDDVTEEGYSYVAEFLGEDGYTYRLRLDMRMYNALGVYGFIVRGFTRVQNFTFGEYDVEVERIIASNYVGYDAGKIYRATLHLEESSKMYTYGNKVYFVVEKTGDDKKIESVEYYVASFTEETIGSDGEVTKVALYTGVTVSEMVTTRYESSDGKSYVDISETEGVVFLMLGDTPYIADSCTYDETTKTYTVDASSGKVFTVKVAETGSVIITDITENA